MAHTISGYFCVTPCTFARSCEAVSWERGLLAIRGTMWREEGCLHGKDPCGRECVFWGRGVCKGNRDVYVGIHAHMWRAFPIFPGFWVCPDQLNSKCSFFGTVASSLVWHLKNLGESFKDQKTPFTWAPEGFTFCDMVIPVDWALSPVDEPMYGGYFLLFSSLPVPLPSSALFAEESWYFGTAAPASFLFPVYFWRMTIFAPIRELCRVMPPPCSRQ